MADGMDRKSSFYGSRRKTAAFAKSGLRGSVHGETVLKDGYLEKKASGVTKRWQSRYFELSGHYLRYYDKKDAASESVKGAVDLKALLTIAAQGSHILIVVSGHQKIELKAPSPQAAETWVAQIEEVCDALGVERDVLRKDSYHAGNLSTKQTTLLRQWAKEMYEKFMDEDADRFYLRSLNELCAAKDLLGDDLSEADLTAIFQSVKVKAKYLGVDEFLEALRKIATKKDKTYEEIVEAISGKSLSDVDLEEEEESDVAPAAKKDEFEKIDTLGGGGQGTTILVKHLPTSNEYAAKLIMCANLEDAKLANEEARLMRDMRGPQFVEFKDSFIIKGNLETHELWIVMKHYKNGDLSKTLRRAEGMRIEEERLGGILTPVLEGLRQMHAESMMHRDIKPGEYRTELYCTALYCTALYCTALHCTILHW
jgi:hypothetical protein